MKPMESKRLVVTPVTLDDAPCIVEAIQTSALQNLSFFSGKDLVTVEEEQAYLGRAMSDPSELLYLIVCKEGRKLVGTVGLHNIDIVNRNARLGISIFRPENRGKGYATEALELLMAHAFTGHRLDNAGNTFHKLYLNVFVDNERAQRPYAGMGFKKDGILRQHYLLNGEWRDMVQMSRLKWEWERLPGLSQYNLEPSS